MKRRWTKELAEEERIERDPALPLRTPKKRETLTMGELERLLSQPARDDVWERHFPGKPERDRLLLALMAYAGLRRSELLGLEWDDVDLSRRLLRVRKAKGGRQRTSDQAAPVGRVATLRHRLRFSDLKVRNLKSLTTAVAIKYRYLPIRTENGMQ